MKSAVDRDYVQEVGRIYESETARSLKVLQSIEVTCGVLHANADVLRRGAKVVHDLVERINACRGSKGLGHQELDPDGQIETLFRSIQTNAARSIDTLVQKREMARVAPELHEDDGVVEAYDHMIDAARDFHNALAELIIAVLEHDADVSPPVGTFTSADDLIAFLKR